MALPNLSSKHIQIDKANRSVVLIIAACISLIIFGLFMGRALYKLQGFQSRVISEKKVALDQLEKNVEAKDIIVESYQKFMSGPTNVLGGNPDPNAAGKLDGDNARLVLDALPSKYDFPALLTSAEALMTENQFTIQSISGQDDEVNQAIVEAQAEPQPLEMPYEIAASNVPYSESQKMMGLLHASIRPFKFTALTLTAAEGNNLDIKAQLTTFYQPPKELTITTKVVK